MIQVRLIKFGKALNNDFFQVLTPIDEQTHTLLYFKLEVKTFVHDKTRVLKQVIAVRIRIWRYPVKMLVFTVLLVLRVNERWFNMVVPVVFVPAVLGERTIIVVEELQHTLNLFQFRRA